MGLGVDIRIDAHRNRRDYPAATARADSSSSSGSDSTLKQWMPAASAKSISRAVLPMPENMILAGRDAGRQRAAQLAFRHHVGAGAELAEQLDDGLVGIGLHGVADQCVEAGERLAEDVEMAGQRGRRIAIERRAHRARDLRQRHVFGAKHAVAVVEMVHAGLVRSHHLIRRSRRKGLSSTGFTGSGGSGSLAFSASLRAWTAAS